MANDTPQESTLPMSPLTEVQPFDAARSSRRRLILRSMLAAGIVVTLATTALVYSMTRPDSQLEPSQLHTIRRGELLVTVTEQGTLESSNNTEIKNRVRGANTIIWVIPSGSMVKAGDELVRLETLHIDDEITERTKFAHLANAEVARAKADVARAELAVAEYVDGRFISELSTMQKDLAIAESNSSSARDMLEYSRKMARSRYVSPLEVEEKEFAVSQADLNVKLTKTKIEVLKKFTREEELAKLNGDLKAAQAKFEAEKEKAAADEQRLKRAKEELAACVLKADHAGIVIYPTSEDWDEAPKIEEGATVNKDQILLLMPDLKKMQVKVGIHESVVERISPGLAARVKLVGQELDGTVSSVAPVTRPSGWWTGNVVKYDTVVELPRTDGVKPGMSVGVEFVLARHTNVLMIPTTAVLETKGGHACWVQTAAGAERRSLKIGDYNNMFIVVEDGVSEGEQVILDPLSIVKQAQLEAAELPPDSKPRTAKSKAR